MITPSIMEMIHLQLLGQPKISLANETITNWSSYKTLALLAYLVTTGETYTRPQLEGLLWGDFEQSKAQNSLRSALYNINKLLDNPLITGRKTAVFNFDRPHYLDIQQFRQAITQGDIARLEKAVQVYQGEFLQGIYIDDAPEFEVWLLRERERLRQDYLNALRQLIEHAKELRQYEKATELLRQLLAVEPWLEVAHRQLMSVLARQGAYNEALRQYEQCQVMLQEELGVDPMPETTALYERILDLRQNPPQNHLPTLPERTIGRQAELTALTQQLSNGRLNTILGVGGVGKTHLALALGHDHARHFLHGVHYVPLAPVTQPRFFTSAVAKALQLTLPANQPVHRALHDYLCERELLLILDNAEHLLDECADFCYELLQDAPDIRLLVTSREPLQLRQEHIFTLEGLDKETAITFFTQRARRIQHDFVLDQTNDEDIQDICQLLVGSPLALELAAAQLAQSPASLIRQQIHANLDSLTVQWRDIPDRHRTLRAVFNQSWELLTAVEQQPLAQLTVFQGGFTLEAAHEVAGASKHLLQTLVAKSLLRIHEDRYTIHGLVRQFAKEEAEKQAITARIQKQHAVYFCQELARLSETAKPSIDYLSALTQEQDNVQVAWETAVVQQEWSLLDQSVHGLAQLHEFTNRFQTVRWLFEFALEQLDRHAETKEQKTTLAKLQARASAMLWRTGDVTNALALAQQSESVLKESEQPREWAFVLNLIGVFYIHTTGDFPAAIQYLKQCVDIYESLQMYQMVMPQINLGSVYFRSGDYEQAIRTFEKALPHVIEGEDRRGLAHVYNNLGVSYLLTDQLESARDYFEKCLFVCDEVRYFSVKAVVLHNLGEVCVEQGAYEEAIAFLTDGIELAQELKNPVTELNNLAWQTLAYHRLGMVSDMVQCGQKGLALAQELADSPPVLMDWLSLVTTVASERGLSDIAYKLGAGVLAQAPERQAKDRILKTLGCQVQADETLIFPDLLGLADIWTGLAES